MAASVPVAVFPWNFHGTRVIASRADMITYTRVRGILLSGLQLMQMVNDGLNEQQRASLWVRMSSGPSYSVEFSGRQYTLGYYSNPWEHVLTTDNQERIVQIIILDEAPAFVTDIWMHRNADKTSLYASSEDQSHQRNMARRNASARLIQQRWKQALETPNSKAQAVAELAQLDARRRAIARVADGTTPNSVWRRRMLREFQSVGDTLSA